MKPTNRSELDNLRPIHSNPSQESDFRKRTEDLEKEKTFEEYLSKLDNQLEVLNKVLVETLRAFKTFLEAYEKCIINPIDRDWDTPEEDEAWKDL